MIIIAKAFYFEIFLPLYKVFFRTNTNISKIRSMIIERMHYSSGSMPHGGSEFHSSTPCRAYITVRIKIGSRSVQENDAVPYHPPTNTSFL